MPGSGSLRQVRVPTQRDCCIKATIAELRFGTVGGYVFSELSDPNCEIYLSSIDKIVYNQLHAPGDAWYVKIPDDITYEGRCADQDIKRLIERAYTFFW